VMLPDALEASVTFRMISPVVMLSALKELLPETLKTMLARVSKPLMEPVEAPERERLWSEGMVMTALTVASM